MNTSEILRDARAVLEDTIQLRRRIHRQPEIGLSVPRTQAAVLEALAGLGLDVRTGERTTSVVARLTGARPGPTILLRADMDALPMQEETGLPFASEVKGAMHACGHDAHTAMLVGAARLLADRRDMLAGSVLFMFQPGEEGYHGARLMIEVDPARFEEMVGEALDGLPEELGRLMSNVAVTVEHGPGPPGLLGLYEGIPLTSRTTGYAGVLPDRITIYRLAICAVCQTEHDVVEEVRRTVVHEVGHHFGIDDARLTELGW